MSAKAKKEETEEEGPKKTSIVVHIVSFLIVTALSAGAGFGASIFLKKEAPVTALAEAASQKEGGATVPEDDEDAKPGKTDAEQAKVDAVEGEQDKDSEAEKLSGYAKPLAPILTNLAAPKDVWVRLELAVVSSQQMTDELLEQIHQDLFAYVRTVKLHHVEGPSGYLNLKAELDERAAIRSGGSVTKVLVRTMLFE